MLTRNLIALLLLAFTAALVIAETPRDYTERTVHRSVANPAENIALRSTVIKKGIVVMTIRNNNSLPVKNIYLRITFSPAMRHVSAPVHSFDCLISDLILPGTDYEFSTVDPQQPQLLGTHSSGSVDEWIPIPQFLSADLVSK